MVVLFGILHMLGELPALLRIGIPQRDAFGEDADVRSSVVMVTLGTVARVEVVSLVLQILFRSELQTVSKTR